MSKTTKLTNYDKIINQHYNKVAETAKNKKTSTMENLYVRDKETDFIKKIIKKYLKSNNKINEIRQMELLDIGCGNGYTLSQLSKIYNLKYSGVEFNSSLRKIASHTLSKKKTNIVKGDIRKNITNFKSKFDIIISQRVIINLLNSNDQQIALKNLINYLKPNGLLIAIEAFDSGLSKLNLARKEFGLEKINSAHHNLYLKSNFFKNNKLIEYDNSFKEYLSSHYFVSRVLHQSYLDASKTKFSRNSHFVSFLTQALPPGIGQYSPIKLLSFLKKNNDY